MNNVQELLNNVLGHAIHPPEPHPGDYTADGIIHCGTCRKPRQMWIEILDERRLVPIMCKCEEEQFDRQQKQARAQERRILIQDMTTALVNMGAAYWPAARFQDNDNRSQKNTRTLLRYVEKFKQVYADNIGLMLYGEAGCGKTFFAECVANALTEAGYFAWMTTIRAISAAMGQNYGESRAYLMQRIREVDLLILDDFGAERDTSYMSEQVYDIINERYKAAKPLLVTTNLDPSVMAQEGNITAKRIYERVMEMCTPLRIEGQTRRRSNAAGKMNTLKNILEED